MMRTGVSWNLYYSRFSATAACYGDAAKQHAWVCLLHSQGQAALSLSSLSSKDIWSAERFIRRVLEQSYVVTLKARMWNYMALYQNGERRQEIADPKSKHYAASYILRQNQSGNIYQTEGRRFEIVVVRCMTVKSPSEPI